MSESLEYTEIPYQQLSQDALQGVIQEFVNREGTDYGLIELSFDEKCQQLLSEIQSGRAVIVFDHQTQSVGVMPKDQV